jgi:hypothetical protein
MHGADVTAGSAGSFEHHYVVPSLHQFIGAGQASDATTHDYDPFVSPIGLGPGRVRTQRTCHGGCADFQNIATVDAQVLSRHF